MHFSSLFHMNLTFPFDQKQTSTKYLLNINSSLEMIVNDSLVCVKVMYYSPKLSAKAIKRKNRNSLVRVS